MNGTRLVGSPVRQWVGTVHRDLGLFTNVGMFTVYTYVHVYGVPAYTYVHVYGVCVYMCYDVCTYMICLCRCV